MNKYQQMYQMLTQVVPEAVLKDPSIGSGKSKAKGFMDLGYDALTRRDDNKIIRIALAHHFEQEGDLVPDPDMEIRVDMNQRTVEALTFQDQRRYDEVYDEKGNADTRLKQSLNEFLMVWLKNLIDQGHRIVPNVEEKPRMATAPALAVSPPIESKPQDIRCHNAHQAAMEVMMEECGGAPVRLVRYSDSVVMAVPEKVYMGLGTPEARKWIDDQLMRMTPHAEQLFGKPTWEHLIDYAESIIYLSIAEQMPGKYGTIMGKRTIEKKRKCDLNHDESKYVFIEQGNLPHPIIRCSQGHVQMFVQDFAGDTKG